MPEVRVAIVGVGNCANSLLQGLSHYADANDAVGSIPHIGLVRAKIGPYHVHDIDIVCGFDVTAGKVDGDIGHAIWAWPNDTFRFANVEDDFPARVYRGPTLDGIGLYLGRILKESAEAPVDVAAMLRKHKVDVVVNYLPVGSEEAATFYANAAIEAGCAFVNCMPVFIASNPERAQWFKDARLPIIGDDIKSQVGSTIVHRQLATLFRDRGVRLDRTYQLNIGGNGDFLNMLERERLISKKISKTNAVISVAGVNLNPDDVHVGPSDYVKWLGDRKFAYIVMEGTAFGGAPLRLELKLEVWDSPNSAGIVIDAIRCAKLALDNQNAGPVIQPSAYFMKSPPQQFDDDDALNMLEGWINAVAAVTA